jgi:hypothetical protein
MKIRPVGAELFHGETEKSSSQTLHPRVRVFEIIHKSAPFDEYVH